MQVCRAAPDVVECLAVGVVAAQLVDVADGDRRLVREAERAQPPALVGWHLVEARVDRERGVVAAVAFQLIDVEEAISVVVHVGVVAALVRAAADGEVLAPSWHRSHGRRVLAQPVSRHLAAVPRVDAHKVELHAYLRVRQRRGARPLQEVARAQLPVASKYLTKAAARADRKRRRGLVPPLGFAQPVCVERRV